MTDPFGPVRIPTGSLLALSLLCVSATGLSQPEPAEGVHIYQIDHGVRSERGETIRIVNPFGNVRIRAIPHAGEPSLRVTVQSEIEEPAPVRLKAGDGESGPVYALVAGKRPGNLVRADLVVGLPDRAGLDVELNDGDFTMHAATYPVRLRAGAGDVDLRTSGPVDVEVRNGKVTYNPPDGRAPAGGRIQTSGAPVDVLARGAGPLAFRIISGAAVTTDSIELMRTRRTDGRAVVFGDTEAAGVLRIQTDHAPVRLVLEGFR
ncbi:MAG: hypothetical protein ACNS61_07815 [Candidatus Wenzhouxiangella sp. M2_3B_020]